MAPGKKALRAPPSMAGIPLICPLCLLLGVPPWIRSFSQSPVLTHPAFPTVSTLTLALTSCEPFLDAPDVNLSARGVFPRSELIISKCGCRIITDFLVQTILSPLNHARPTFFLFSPLSIPANIGLLPFLTFPPPPGQRTTPIQMLFCAKVGRLTSPINVQ